MTQAQLDAFDALYQTYLANDPFTLKNNLKIIVTFIHMFSHYLHSIQLLIPQNIISYHLDISVQVLLHVNMPVFVICHYHLIG